MDVFDLQAKISLDTSAYEKSLSQVESSTGEAGSSMESSIGGAEGTFNSFSSAVSAKAIVIGNAIYDMGKQAASALAGFAKDSVNTGMDFDSAMSQVAATMGKTTDEIQELRDYALEMGSTTSFSATQSAEALNYMALAGYDTEESMSMLPNVLNLAAAGGMELATASDMVTDAQSALGLSFDQTTTMVNQMAKASSITNTSVEQLGDAILTVGGTASSLSGGTTELAATLGILADNSIKGAEGGTHLRNILLAMNPTTDAAAAAWEELGVSGYDADGNLRPLGDTFQDLSKAMEGMSDQEKTDLISTMFNTTDLSAVNALLATTGDRWDEVTEAVDKAGNAASDMADTQLDNLAGDVTLYQSALEGAQIALSDKLTPTLRDFVQFGTEGLTELTNAINSDDPFGALGQMADSAFESLQSALPGIINQGIQMGTGLAQSLGSAIMSKAPAVMSQAMSLATGLMQSLGKGIKAKLPAVLSQALPLVAQFASYIRANAGTLIDSGMEMLLNITQGIADSIPTLVSYIPGIVTDIAGIINDNAPKLLVTGIQMIGKLAMGIVQAAPTIAANIPQIIKAVAAVITAYNWVNLGGKIIKGIVNGIKKIGATAPTALSNIAKNAAAKFTSFNWSTAGRSALQAVVNGVKGLASAIPNALRSIGQSGLNAFKNINWGSVGRFIVQGIISGISGAASSLYSSLKSLASSALNAAKQKLDIGSPSKLFAREVGAMIPAGIAVGISQNSGLVDDAVSSLADVPELSASGISVANAGSTVQADTGNRIEELLETLITEVKNGKQIYLDGNTLVGSTVGYMDAALGRRSRQVRRGY